MPRKPWLFILFFFSAVLFDCIAYAQTQDCPIKLDNPGAATEADGGLVCFKTTLGRWFPMAKARPMLKELTAGRYAVRLAPKKEALLQLSKQRVKLQELELATQTKIAQAWKEAAEKQAAQLRQQNSFWTRPSTWFALGVIVTAAASVAISSSAER